MARKFLYFIAICIVLFIAGAIALRFWADELTELAFTPQGEFVAQEPLAENAYESPDLWISRPGMGQSDPSQWRPRNFREDAAASTTAVFFIHPTSYIERDYWNAPVEEPGAMKQAELYVRGMATPFNRSVNIWAPRYRQAAVGALITDKPEALRAVDAAYADVVQAFDYFVSSIETDTPIVLAGHSQGAMHLIRLIKDKVAGTPLADRIVAAYPVGWPISVARDLPAMGLPACAAADQAGCVMGWQSFAEPADPDQLIASYDREVIGGTEGFDPNDVLCSNPILGTRGGRAPADANLGTLVPDGDFSDGELVKAAVPANCDPRGVLLVGDPPDLGNAVMPGNNYHVYDIPLFWANLRADFARREAAWHRLAGGTSASDDGAVPMPGSTPGADAARANDSSRQ